MTGQSTKSIAFNILIKYKVASRALVKVEGISVQNELEMLLILSGVDFFRDKAISSEEIFKLLYLYSFNFCIGNFSLRNSNCCFFEEVK